MPLINFDWKNVYLDEDQGVYIVVAEDSKTGKKVEVHIEKDCLEILEKKRKAN